MVERHTERAAEGTVVVSDGETYARPARCKSKWARLMQTSTRAEAFSGVYSHRQFAVVQEVLHRVEAGELVQDLRAVGDYARGGVYGVDHTRDVDVLDVGEVSKLPSTGLIDCLLETCVGRSNQYMFKGHVRPRSKQYRKCVVAGCDGSLVNGEPER